MRRRGRPIKVHAGPTLHAVPLFSLVHTPDRWQVRRFVTVWAKEGSSNGEDVSEKPPTVVIPLASKNRSNHRSGRKANSPPAHSPYSPGSPKRKSKRTTSGASRVTFSTVAQLAPFLEQAQLGSLGHVGEAGRVRKTGKGPRVRTADPRDRRAKREHSIQLSLNLNQTKF